MSGQTHDFPPLCEAFSAFVAGTSHADIPADVIAAAKHALLDSAGVTVAAVSDHESHAILDYTRQTASGGTSHVFGTGLSVNAELAALANGTLSHVLDFDDTHIPMGHPSAPVMAALFAVADELGASGRDVLTAFVLGFEVECKLARVTAPLLYTRGWHPTAVLGVFGAAAAAARIMNLTQAQIGHAIATAASMCGGIKGNFGTLSKPLQVGRVAQNGVQAARLAACGNTGNPKVFEARMGYLELYCSRDPTDWNLAEVHGRLGCPWELVDPGVTVKPYPCGGSTHSTVEAHLQLRQREAFTPDDIVSIENGIHERRLTHTNRPSVGSGLEGKFSNQYVTALAWLKGCISLDHFTDEVARDPAMTAFMRKVRSVPDPEISKSLKTETQACVRVTLKDGRVFEQRVVARRGSKENPLSPGDLAEKFRLCAGTVHTSEWADQAMTMFDQLDTLADVRSLTGHLGRAPTRFQHARE
jgi:2-methylcitrate dehydratase PrpD